MSSFNVKSEILAAIAKTNDENMKMILLLMLGVLEEIGSKVDAVLKDEQSLRDTVLNGHAMNHDRHHEWVERRMAANHCEQVCGWAKNKMILEDDEKKANITSARRIRDNLIERAGWLVLCGLIAWMGLK